MMSTPFGATRAAKATAEPTGYPQTKKPPAAPKAIFTVDRTDDVSPPAMGCDDMVANDCSLRGAVIKANTTAGTDTISVPAGTYTLSIPGIGEEAAATGDLDLTQSVIIQGAGAGGTIIQAGTTSPVPTPANCTDCIDRVFHVLSAGVTAEFMEITIRHGSEGNAGGAIFNSGTAKLTNCTLTNNHAANGGGIMNSSGLLEVTGSTLSSNFGSTNGGGILHGGGTATIINSTLSNNLTTSSGGGVLNAGSMTITASTLSHNSAGGGGGGGIFNVNNLIIKNSIVANNLAGGNCSSPFGTFTALGKNFDTDGTCAALDADFMQVTPAQLNLGPLQNNGGATQTHALLMSSVALDAVTDCTRLDGVTVVTVDQRGVMRPIDGDGNATALCDAGAYEAPTPTSQVYMVDRTDDVNPPATGCNDTVPNDCSLRGAVIKANTTVVTVSITVPTGTYTLAIAGQGEDAAMTGDLDLTRSVTIQGAGAASTIIQAGASSPVKSCSDCIDRVFHIPSSSVTAEFKDITIRHGVVTGGGIFNDGGTLEITNSTVSDNDGGGIFNDGGTLEITNSTLSNNLSTNGAGILNDGGTLEITNSTLSNNVTFFGGGNSGRGGGILNRGLSSATITGSTLSNNSAENNGGGITNDVGTLEITNSTLSGNDGTNNGGGIFNGGAATISNCTLSGNHSFISGGGGGIRNEGQLTIKNSIVANSPSGGNCSNTGTFTALGMNFDTDGTGAALDADFMQVTPAQLNLGPLQNNSGPTQTHALIAGSVAIDAVTDCTLADGATPVTVDQRGVTRPIDADGNGTALCDAGAFEAPAALVFTVDRTDDVNPPATGCNDMVPNDCSLRGAVIKSNTLITSDRIIVPAGTYTLTIAGTGEDVAMTGDLDLTQLVTIQGAGAANTIIQAGTSSPVTPSTCTDCIDRVFHVVSGIVTAEFKDITIRHGVENDGGGVFNNGGTSKIMGSTLSSNLGLNEGGGIFNIGGTVEITGSTVSGNHGINGGGGILNFVGTARITNSTLSNNLSNNGGAVDNNNATAIITNSTLSGNQALIGGGINNINLGMLEITNSTLSNNSAINPGGFGGGIFNQGLSSATITGSTLSNNSASVQGGGIDNGGDVTIKNSIVANSPTGGDCVNSGNFTALGKNFDTDGTCAALDPDFMQVTPAQLNLGPLQNNGGATETRALLTGSAAIDAVTDCTLADGVTAVTVDQRGVVRPLDGDGNGSFLCDVGAFEVACGVLTKNSQFFTARGGEDSVMVTALAGCSWSASPNVSWIVITSNPIGTGTGVVNYLVRENFTGAPRQATITIAGHLFTVFQGTQSVPACVIAIAPANAAYSASGGSGSVSVTAGSLCAWPAVSNQSWITITSSSGGIGNGTVTYTVGANPGPSGRNGTITIGGKVFAIKQK
jgi:hypothetical protein